MTEMRARYFDGESARRIDALVQLGPENLVIRAADGAVLAVWPLADVRLTVRPADGRPLRLGRNREPARAIVDDADFLHELERLCPDLHKHRPRFREVWRPVLLWGGAAAASLAFIFLVAIPVIAQWVAAAIPPDAEARLGKAAVDQVVQYFTDEERPNYCSTPQGDRVLAALTDRFTAQLDLPFPLEVRIVESSIVNAFALPGGQIVMFDGLLDYAERPEEVAGVLAHEIGHVLHRHPMEVFTKNVGSAALIGFLLGDITSGSVVGALAQFTVTSAYSREAEREADAEAVALLNGAGIDGSGLVDFFERLDEEPDTRLDEILAVVSSHPPTDERSALARGAATATGRAMDEADWRALQTICGGE